MRPTTGKILPTPSTQAVLKEGILYKRALHSARNWKERRIVLKLDQLEWYAHPWWAPKEQEPR